MLEGLLTWLDAMGHEVHHPGVLAVLGGAAAIEYVMPVFPGDTVTLVGGILISAYGWNPVLLFAVLMLGSVGGGLAVFLISRRVVQKRPVDPEGKVGRIAEGFARRGPLYLLGNRFLPGIRPFFFVAAAVAGMNAREVLLWSALSAAIWNGLLLFAGALLGNNLEALQDLFVRYSYVAWGLLGAFAIWWLTNQLRNRRN